ncbi:MAG: dienelactone hydrolase family protein [Gemmatimonadaceae bacterium]
MNRTDVTTTQLDIRTGDGVARAGLFVPDTLNVTRSAVLFYMDGIGYRPALHAMAEQYAAAGYVVLLPDLFYRTGRYDPFDAKTAFRNDGSKAIIMANIHDTTQAMTRRDGHAFLATLNDAGATGPVGVVGYCMGGARALHAAAAFPERIRAAASFHGGGLATDKFDSPHLVARDIKARLYVGCAGVDASFPPEQSAQLAEALRRAEVDHTIENYVGMQHGWTVPDHLVFNATGAARHWKRVLMLFEETLL